MTELCTRVLAEVHRALCEQVARLASRGRPGTPVLLDVGCWDGAATARYAGLIAARPLGIEVFDGPARAAEARGIEVARLDLETEPFPWANASVDVVVCNQVLEHLKNVWMPMSEIHRVLVVGGHVLVSVPNLASLHNRVCLALGFQPTSIRTFGPHVRGFTRREFERFVTRNGAFELVRSLSIGFHPFPPAASRPLTALWPGGGHTLVLVARKSARPGSPWRDHLAAEAARGVQTFYG